MGPVTAEDTLPHTWAPERDCKVNQTPASKTTTGHPHMGSSVGDTCVQTAGGRSAGQSGHPKHCPDRVTGAPLREDTGRDGSKGAHSSSHWCQDKRQGFLMQITELQRCLQAAGPGQGRAGATPSSPATLPPQASRPPRLSTARAWASAGKMCRDSRHPWRDSDAPRAVSGRPRHWPALSRSAKSLPPQPALPSVLVTHFQQA